MPFIFTSEVKVGCRRLSLHTSNRYLSRVTVSKMRTASTAPGVKSAPNYLTNLMLIKYSDIYTLS